MLFAIFLSLAFFNLKKRLSNSEAETLLINEENIIRKIFKSVYFEIGLTDIFVYLIIKKKSLLDNVFSH